MPFDGGDDQRRLVALATSLGVAPSDLAGVVHHTAYEEALTGDATAVSPTSSRKPEDAFDVALSINAAGPGRQVAYLASRVGAVDTERLLRAAVVRATLDDLHLLEDLEPVSDSVAAVADGLDLRAADLSVLAHQHSLDHRDSYLLLYDNAAMLSDIPGAREYVGLHITRDPTAGTFDLADQEVPLWPLARVWLLALGCPAPLYPAGSPIPADAGTVRIEHTIATSPDRYSLVEDYTHNPGTGAIKTSVILLDHQDTASPYRLLVEDTFTTSPTFTYRVVEHGFATAQEASEAFEALLPPPPDFAVGRLPPTPPSSPGRRRTRD
ncbi:hypothetical protein EBN88_00440 [Streptomyces triticirhizae]|uniref:Uncharacterized protein n=1 Tax=Streptomyces triticirhizae TaxID=2483353 RepID=A0A3M2MDL2_9ACTN|nr:hypothetical protein EBN88_00440 [Streptomyces triticirhizae]